MSNATTLARPYAKAAFELAEADNAVSSWHDMLGLASAAVTEKSLAGLLESPHASGGQIVQILTAAAGDTFDAKFRKFLDVLADNKRLSLLPEIGVLYQELREEAEKLLRVRVVSAFPLEEEQAARLKQALAKRFDREILLEPEVDRSVIGGAVIYAGDQVIDGSLKDRLTRLANSLSN